MPQYKLTYFNTKARGEIARLLFALAGQDYIDNRVEAGEQWAKLKASMPFYQMPVLEVDGQEICQSGCINRYLANQFGFAGKTAWERARADMIADTLVDFTAPLVKIDRGTKDEKEKEELRKKFQEENIPMFLSRFEKQLDDKSGYFAGDGLTYADVAFFHHTHYLDAFKFEVNWEKYPKCKALRAAVASHPKIAEWVQKRPVTVL